MRVFKANSGKEDFSACTVKYYLSGFSTITPQTHKMWKYMSFTDVPYNKFYFNLSGKIIFSVNGVEYNMEPGYLYFIPKSTFQTFKLVSESADQYWLHFDVETSYLEHDPTDSVPICVKCDKEKVISIFNQIIGCGKRCDNVLKRCMLISKLYEYYLSCAEFADISDRIITDRRYAAILKYIRENYQNKIAPKEIAEFLHLNPSYFTRYFKKTFKMTPTDLINIYRINKARLLLQKTNYPVAKVAQKCGFESYSYFARLFKKITDQTPLEHRKYYREHDNDNTSLLML